MPVLGPDAERQIRLHGLDYDPFAGLGRSVAAGLPELAGHAHVAVGSSRPLATATAPTSASTPTTGLVPPRAHQIQNQISASLDDGRADHEHDSHGDGTQRIAAISARTSSN